MQWSPVAMLKLVVPLALLAAALALRGDVAEASEEWQLLLRNLPYLLCLVAGFMAFQFNRGRLLLAVVSVAAFYWAVQQFLQVSLARPEAAKMFFALSLASPLVALYLLLLPEQGIISRGGLAAAGGFLLLLLVALYLLPLLPVNSESAARYYAIWPWENYVLSRGASLLVGVVTLAAIVLIGLRNEDADVAIIAAALACSLMLAQLQHPMISVVLGIAASLTLVWGLLRSSHAMAYRDELTGIPGRRALNERMKLLGRRYCIAMLDVDHFKRFNDTHGHDVGDEVLRLVASRLSRVGGGGTAYRYGGEEFCVVFPRRSIEECVGPVNAVREEIANYRMLLRNRSQRPARARDGTRRRGATRLASDEVAVTVSAGLAERCEDVPDVEAVIKAADSKLYQAKKAGRNRVMY
ncbi:MAG: GGDEF domain-containing protein [Halioglobus sp.]|nr:GGDEF domain-containing protein [Halioglobus sp.]